MNPDNDAVARLRDRLRILAEAFDGPATTAWQAEFDRLAEAEAVVAETDTNKDENQ